MCRMYLSCPVRARPCTNRWGRCRCPGGSRHGRGQPMAAQDAATELIGLWPRLPQMVGPTWPQVRPQTLNLAGLIRAAETDEERVTHTESLLELLLPYPAVAEI